jgi:transcriptional regulator with XRE-family HTH domain
MCTIGQRLHELRKRAGLSLDDVAQAAGMSKSGVWEVEANRNDPRLSTIRKLARALGVDVYQLLSEDDLSPSLSTLELRVIHAVRNAMEEGK